MNVFRWALERLLSLVFVMVLVLVFMRCDALFSSNWIDFLLAFVALGLMLKNHQLINRLEQLNRAKKKDMRHMMDLIIENRRLNQGRESDQRSN